jgi:hypothetical protein
MKNLFLRIENKDKDPAVVKEITKKTRNKKRGKSSLKTNNGFFFSKRPKLE